MTELAGNSLKGYDDILFSCNASASEEYIDACPYHTLAYVYSGILVIEENMNRILAAEGECIFMQRGSRLSLSRHPCYGNIFSSVSIRFRPAFLKDFYAVSGIKELPAEAVGFCCNVITIPKTPSIESLYISLTPFCCDSLYPSPEIIRIKMFTAIYTLLQSDPGFYPVLFDFITPLRDLQDPTAKPES